MKDENKINSCPNVHSKSARRINALFTGLPRCARNDTQKAFTIVELLVVIVVIAILAAITIVSYRSVSSNARKSAMASDLEQANKSLQVNKETSSSETFPSTLSSAGVTLSNNATYSYNVSADGSNYCLQGTVDGVTKSIAGNNQTVSNSTCVSATNLITNGDFSQGTSGWWTGSTYTLSTNDHILSSLANVQYAGTGRSYSAYSDLKGHVLYAAIYMKTSYLSNYMGLLNDGITQQSKHCSIANEFCHLSATASISTSATVLYNKIYDARTSGYDEIYIKYAIMLDLTTIFNSGNEPTAAEMDAILANFPNSWFNGQNVIQVPTS